MAGALFDQGVSLGFLVIICHVISVLIGSFLSDSSKELSSAAESQENIAAAAKETADALGNDVESSNLLVGIGLGFGLTIVALLCCVLARFIRCFKHVF